MRLIPAAFALLVTAQSADIAPVQAADPLASDKTLWLALPTSARFLNNVVVSKTSAIVTYFAKDGTMYIGLKATDNKGAEGLILSPGDSGYKNAVIDGNTYMIYVAVHRSPVAGNADIEHRIGPAPLTFEISVHLFPGVSEADPRHFYYSESWNWTVDFSSGCSIREASYSAGNEIENQGAVTAAGVPVCRVYPGRRF